MTRIRALRPIPLACLCACGGLSSADLTKGPADDPDEPDVTDVPSDSDSEDDAEDSGDGDATPPDDGDSDGDGLSDEDERRAHTDPDERDSDGDGLSDGLEVAGGSDPTDPASVLEGIVVTVPERLTVEGAYDFELKIGVADIAFLLDTTCSMSSTLHSMADEYSQLVDEVSAEIPFAEYGVATFDDYPTDSMGTAGSDKPFWLQQQVTDDLAVVQSTLSGLSLDSGGDTPEAGMEALYQALAGGGYDMDCDGHYDGSTEVLPFQADASDPFGGAAGDTYDPSTSGGGTLGGMGFRANALPIVVYATDAPMRDADSGSYPTPGGCPRDAGADNVANAASHLGAYLIGIGVGAAPIAQMQSLATATGSLADTDGDGHVDDPLAFVWTGGSSATLRATIVDAIASLVTSLEFATVTVAVEDDPLGFVANISPDEIDVDGMLTGDTVTFELELRGVVPAVQADQLFHVTVDLLGDGKVILDRVDVAIVVPGWGT